MHGKVRLYEHITFFQTKWGIFVYDDNSIKDFILQLFTANFCLPELMFSFNVSILLVSVEIIAHTVIILLIPLLSNLFVNSFWCLLFFYTRNFAHFFNEFVSSHKNKENLLFYIVMIKLHVCYFFLKSSFSEKFSSESYQICSFGNQN